MTDFGVDRSSTHQGSRRKTDNFLDLSAKMSGEQLEIQAWNSEESSGWPGMQDGPGHTGGKRRGGGRGRREGADEQAKALLTLSCRFTPFCFCSEFLQF